MPVTCCCPSTALWSEHLDLMQLSQMKQKVERDKKQGRPQISFPPAEVTNLTQNSRKQLLIEQDGE